MIKTFRGLLAHNAQDRIKLSTIKGKVGYRIVKFEILTKDPFSAGTVKHVLKIYKTSQSTLDDTVNFTETDLLGAATYMETVDLDQAGYGTIIFDQETFNQDIYISHFETSSNAACNYYIELEVIPLDDKGAEYTTLQDIRTHVSSTI